MFEDLSTLKALVWVLSTMDDKVPKETSPMSKDVPTFGTHKRFLSSMSPAMQDKIGVVGEGFPTLAALVRPLTTVDPLVLGEL